MEIFPAHLAALLPRKVETIMLVVDNEKKEKFTAGSSILRGDEFLALRGSLELIAEAETMAKEIVSKATDDGEKIIADAQAKAKQITDGADKALEETRAKGHSEGLESGKQEICERLLEISKNNAKEFSGFKESIMHIVMRSIRRILGEMEDVTLMEKIVSTALAPFQKQHQVTLRVSSEQAPSTRVSMEKILKNANTSMEFEVIADGRLEKNSCVLLTDVGIIDASLEVQLKAIEKVVTKIIG
ncbi:MAG: type III secretion system stator protein SctL [Puniceicoccales bacterium]|jgi:type III secretion protein L|nr:type III secretion system stator protein SctL [Puniceicoccales bacterium]